MNNLKEAIKTLHPGYFAMVMSTGIVSIAFKGLGFDLIFKALFFINVATYLVLLCMLVARIVVFTGDFLDDLRHPMRGFGFLTFVVGTNTLGVQFLLLSYIDVAKVLWISAFVCWFLFMYSIYMCLITLASEPIEKAISGATLLTIVSNQSVAVLGSKLASSFGAYSEIVFLTSWIFWAMGFILYLIVITLVTYRLLFRKMEPKDWTGPYWICMGAVAITTLAGSNLVINMDAQPIMEGLSSATLVITFLAWAIGLWWIPIQIFMDIWSLKKVNISDKAPMWIKVFPWLRLGLGGAESHFYNPLAWGRVFPMGMFTACTIALSAASGMKGLFVIPKYWGWFALLVWTLTFIGAMRSVLKSCRNLDVGHA